MYLKYSDSIEPEQRSQIEAEIAPFLWLIPSYVADLTICVVEDRPPPELASMEVDRTYMWASLWISVIWFNRSKRDRGVALVHELLHQFMNPLWSYSRQEFERILTEEKDGKYLKSIENRLRELNETQTQELAHAIYGIAESSIDSKQN